ncbi:hypothetical protein LdCL_110016600 [Leishmania donovani]|uniref:Uncharacterized protein n=1 Tax=Leishmania donovani TaxID=5661 RepID=A0A3S7WRN9_LEIDO|nr:hypothetical protein LdCL_110016600 [Leishmania donovani]
MMRGLSELATLMHQSASVMPAHGLMAAAATGAAASAPVSVPSKWSFTSSSQAVAADGSPLAIPRARMPPHLAVRDTAATAVGQTQELTPLLAAQSNVPASAVLMAMRHRPHRHAYSLVPPTAAVVTGTTPAEESEAAQVRTLRRCLALHWANCVLLCARALTLAGTYDIAVPYELYTDIRTARLWLRERMAEYRGRMKAQFEAACDEVRLARLKEVFARWDADEQRMSANDAEAAGDIYGGFSTATVPQTQQETPGPPALASVHPLGSVTAAPLNPEPLAASSVLRHHATQAITATSDSFASHNTSSRMPTTGAASELARQQPRTPHSNGSRPPSISAHPPGLSVHRTAAAAAASTEKERYHRAFAEPFCFGSSDPELLSVSLPGQSGNAVLVPIHVIVFTSLFTILDVMGDVLLCENPRLSTVVANELLTLLFETRLSVLEPLHEAMAAAERRGSTAPMPDAASMASSPSGSFCLTFSRPDSLTARRSDASMPPASTLAPSHCPPRSSSDDGSGVFVASPAASMALSRPLRRGDGKTRASGASGRTCDSESREDSWRLRRHRNGRDPPPALARGGHILLLNEYALLLEAGLRSPQVVRRWRTELKANPERAACGYASLLYHLQLRQEQWTEESPDEYHLSRRPLRLMLDVTARDVRGNIHGNILHVDGLDVVGSRKEEVAPRLGVTSPSTSLATATYSAEWNPG